jgi:hypothetical protein
LSEQTKERFQTHLKDAPTKDKLTIHLKTNVVAEEDIQEKNRSAVLEGKSLNRNYYLEVIERTNFQIAIES